MKNQRINEWAYCAELTLPVGGKGGVAINLGIANRPPGLLLSARVGSPVVLAQAHRLRLHEDRDISNTQDPERGVHRARQYGNALPEWLRIKLGMVVDDIHVFHAPGTFTDNGGGQVLCSELGNHPRHARTGEWLLVPPANPATGWYYYVEVENLHPDTATFSLFLDYQFVKPQ